MLPRPGGRIEFWSRLNPYDWAANVVDPPALLRFMNELGEDSVTLYFHRTLHAKIYQVDQVWSWIGSPNLTRSAFTTNVELVAEVRDNDVTILDHFIRDIRSSLKRVELSELSDFVELTRDIIERIETRPQGTDDDFEAAVQIADEILSSKSDVILDDQIPKMDDFIQFVRKQQGEIAARVIDHHNNLSGQNRQGHVKQSYYAIYLFLTSHGRKFVPVLRALDIEKFPKIPQDFVTVWIEFVDEFATHSDDDLGYSFSILRNVLPESLGGYVTNGGGASGTFRRIVPLVAHFLDK